MKKIIMAFITSALILTAAGCGGEEKKAEQTTDDGTVSQVAVQMEDTTDEAVKYLRGEVPLFSKYLETRMKYPLTYEVEINTPAGTQTAGIYIKDATSAAIASVDINGIESRTIYTAGKMYQVDGSDKIIYSGDYSEKNSKETVRSYLMKISLSEASLCQYTSDTAEYKGVSYKHETISLNGNTTHYYFDEITDELRYVVSGDTETKITVLNNNVKEEIFVLPEGYGEGTMEEYYAKISMG